MSLYTLFAPEPDTHPKEYIQYRRVLQELRIAEREARSAGATLSEVFGEENDGNTLIALADAIEAIANKLDTYND